MEEGDEGEMEWNEVNERRALRQERVCSEKI